jgi:hypothetical protein
MAEARLTEDQEVAMLYAISVGASMTGAAECVGRSRAWLTRVCQEYPEFLTKIVTARGKFEVQLSADIGDAKDAGDAALVNALVKRRANRFPQRHGEDPRLRHALDVAGDEHPEDLPDSKPQVTGDLDAALRSALEWHYANEGKT